MEHNRKPLTLEELRQMDGKPVFCVSLKDARNKKWRVIQSLEKFVEVVKVICFTDGKDETTSSYGKTWLAYATEPAKLDRSAWKPCRHCKTCVSCKSSICEIDNKSSKCYDCDDMSNYEPIGFCPHCGRPLTNAAWDMLEKRLWGE